MKLDAGKDFLACQYCGTTHFPDPNPDGVRVLDEPSEQQCPRCSVALVQVKGKTQPVEIFTLIGAKADRADAAFLQRLETYEAGFRKFRERDFVQAKILFSQFLEFYPDDSLAKMYLERSLEYEGQPPDAAWNAVEVFKKK